MSCFRLGIKRKETYKNLITGADYVIIGKRSHVLKTECSLCSSSTKISYFHFPLHCAIVTYIRVSIHFQIKKKCTRLQLVCIHLVLFVLPCSTLDPVRRTCVALSIVGNAHTLGGVAVSRGSRWSPHSCVALATRRTPSTSGARRTRGSCSGLSRWPCG